MRLVLDRVELGPRLVGVAVVVVIFMFVSMAGAGPAEAFTYGAHAQGDTANVQYVTPGEAARLARGGVTEVRVPAHWDEIVPLNPNWTCQTNVGAWNWGRTDQALKNLAAQNIRAVLVITRRPFCINNSQEPESLTPLPGSPNNPLGSGAQFPWWPNGQQAYADFARQVALRYGVGGSFWPGSGVTPKPVTHYQIWNEQNFGGRFGPPSNGGPAAYASLLQGAKQAIRSVDPGAQILIGGVNTSGSGVKSYTEWIPNFLQQPNIGQQFNIFAIHPYSSHENSTNGYIGNMAAYVHQYQPNRPIWVTEVGITSQPAPDGFSKPDELGQAQFLYTVWYFLYVYGPSLQIDHAFWYSDHDCNPFQATWACKAGLFYDEAGVSAKQAWTIMTWFTGGTP